MDKVIEFNRSVPVLCDTDVCVVGGGAAGIAATVAAARSGVRVFLGEGCGCYSAGWVRAGLVPAFAGSATERKFLGGRIFREVV